MHVIVVGCGRVGSGLAVALVNEGHTVAVVDKVPSAFRRLPAGWEGDRVVGFGFDRDDLERAGASHATALAAVTNGDNSNIMSARVAREAFEIPAVVARIYDPRRAEIYQRLGIPTVATVTWTTNQVMKRLFPERSSSEWSDADERVHLVERLLPPAWGGKELDSLDVDGQFRLAAVTRAGVSRIPSGGLLGQEGDLLHIAVSRESVERLEKLLQSGPESKA